ncbi:LD-carboxypeptidase [Brevundimonas vesicularis]|uniref:LD-carboxypeptidase n=1 Tax=Brevundimonas vesicularis TaxID=41276 RepID=A0A1Z3U6C9_BREVE|nr:LD-carboxypeptidase [Brevundimonas vesicularis]ASE38839.1 LD-carboxypeptidase [Brevundimonas vesicularis]MDX2335787.1 LD-carboxypeptidase [Brevundimonas vesicularis]
MTTNSFKIGVVCASSRFSRERAEAVEALMAQNHPDRDVAVVFHPACFLKHGHFAGDDRARADAFVEFANDPRIDAIWFARGGYGSCRIADAVIPRLDAVARKKRYMGYSDAGSLLAGMYKAGFQHLAHGPMASDSVRDDATARGALYWLTTGRTDWIEPSLATDPRPAVAFNLTILNELTGTSLEPDLSDHVLMLEEVSEAAYRIDRMMFHLTSQASIRRVAGIRLGRVSDVTPNDPDFGQTPEEIVRYWCLRSGIPFLGSADIGHDAANKVVPFGRP